MDLFSLQPYAKKRICVALSGGVDSVCLLHAFLSHAEEYGIRIFALHVEHGIRGEESLRDLRFCRELCGTWKVPFREERVDVLALTKSGGGIEEMARNARYEIFGRVLREGEADLVATAHHLGDVAETILFRLARGTSLAGMRAITQGQGVIRPLLEIPRERILRYARENSLPFVEDSTNSDERYVRNYIRRSVIPAFEKIHGGAVGHLCEFARKCEADDEFLIELARKEIRSEEGESRICVSLPDPLFTRACLLCMGTRKDYSSSQLRQIEKLKTLQSGRKVCLPGGLFAAREYGDVVFFREEPPIGERPFFREEFLRPSQKGGLRADLDCFPEGCVIRTRKEGDYIIPFGGPKRSLKKFFTERKISARRGKRLSLVANGQEILVVIGVEISDKVKLTEKTVSVGYFRSAEGGEHA